MVKEELFVKVKPGLSSYRHDPYRGAMSIKPLLDRAIEIIPKSYHKMTKISLKATAGLRLVSEKIAKKILNYVNRKIKKNNRFFAFILKSLIIDF